MRELFLFFWANISFIKRSFLEFPDAGYSRRKVSLELRMQQAIKGKEKFMIVHFGTE